MAISISSCLRPSNSSYPPPIPPPPAPAPAPRPSLLNKTALAPWSTGKEASWGSRCVATAACIIVGSSTAGFAGGDATVLAGDLKVTGGSEGKVVRWSDKRKCPPWHVNSLENIMPENLPRPSTGRRSNGLVAYKTAPAVGGASVRYKSSCYSL